jgi:hypothetical protein
MKAVTLLAPKGTYIGVGTERGFIATSINPQIDSSIFIDSDPSVVLYNRINILLLSLAKDASDYVWLRTKAHWSDIQHRLLLQPNIDHGSSDKWMSSHFEWFTYVLRHAQDGDIMASKFQSIDIESNYVQNPVLCERLILMAKEHRLYSVLINLKDLKSISRFERYFSEKLGSSALISIFDVSNAWWKVHAGPESIFQFLKKIKSIHHKQGILLMTTYRKPHSFHWAYFGIQMSSLNEKNLESWYLDQLTPIASNPKTAYFPSRHFGRILQPLNLEKKNFCHQIFEFQTQTQDGIIL